MLITLNNVPLRVSGNWLKEAAICDEEWQQSTLVSDPYKFLEDIKRAEVADWFTFTQDFTAWKPKYSFHYVWDNIAAVPLSTFDDWWENRVSNDLRKDVKRAEKRGVELRVVPFDAALVQGIQSLYNETPIRQGRPFWHYGKSLEQVRAENSTYLERSEFVGAFVEGKLIGFIKIVYVNDVARMMQILALESQQDRRPMNALIAHAVRITAAKGCSYLTYGRYTYDNKKNSTIAQFKHRNGFEEILFPRYYIPLSAKGLFSVRAGLQLSLKRHIPEPIVYWALNFRARLLQRKVRSQPNCERIELSELHFCARAPQDQTSDKAITKL
jgi:hypothetical protein